MGDDPVEVRVLFAASSGRRPDTPEGRAVSALDDLLALVPPPASPPPAVDWDAAHAALGTTLPADFVALAGAYGAGTFGAGIGLLVPGHPNPFLDLVRQTEEQRAALRARAEQGDQPRHDPAALVAWAIDDGGSVLWWHTAGRSGPDRWPVLASEARGDAWEELGGTATAALLALLSGRARSDVLVVEPASGPAAFTPHR